MDDQETPAADAGTDASLLQGQADENQPGNDGGNPADAKAGAEGADDQAEKGDGQAEKGDGQEGEWDYGWEGLTMPNDMSVDEPLMAEFMSVAKEAGLTKEQCQMLIDFNAKHTVSEAENNEQSLQDLEAEWLDEAKADPVLGKHIDAETGHLNNDVRQKMIAGLNHYGDSELMQTFHASGLGNNPSLLKFLMKVGESISEDQAGSIRGSKPPASRDPADIMYG